MGYLLKEALKTLCGVNQWSYAVFWKFGSQNPKLLIWEECYHGPESSCLDVKTGDMVHLLVNKMMIDNHVNVVGEGLVGRVAFTGNHQWILSQNYYKEAHPAEVLKEICQQFSAGMQTVAVIPVLPHGVLQFGSHLTITEDMGFINDVLSLIHQLGHIPGILLSENYAANEIDSPLHSTPRDLSISDSLNYMGNSSQTSFFDNHTSYSFAPSQTSNSSPTVKLDFSSSDSRIWTNQDLPSGNSSTLAEKIPSFIEDYENQNIKYGDDFIESQTGDDLFDILGPDFKNSLFGKNNINNNSSRSSPENSGSGIFSLLGTDHLLDAVVSKTSSSAKQTLSLDDNISCKTTLTNISSSAGPSTGPNISLPYGHLDMKGELLGIQKYLSKAGASSSNENSRMYSHCSSIHDAWIEKGKNVKHDDSVSTGYSKKPHETNKTNRKRRKPGENPRPRPKDRQMIQDRVKELREIVPNGAKCSIDGLLERTIKHMIFMQSVTKHADKLKQNADPKIISKDGGVLLKDNFEGGATWAYELGSQSMVCPIIVEDLNHPRQMLVEMLCEERGMFLEIADIIRGLGLTILKGVMETQDEKIWARFAVEANRDVTRMEIFISLVRLLEQSSKTGFSQHNNICNDDLTVQQFHQVACVTTTGQIC